MAQLIEVGLVSRNESVRKEKEKEWYLRLRLRLCLRLRLLQKWSCKLEGAKRQNFPTLPNFWLLPACAKRATSSLVPFTMTISRPTHPFGSAHLVHIPSIMPLVRRAAMSPEKRNPCTHMTVTRLFDPYGFFKCALCHKHPSLGWLYCCTQDTGGVLPESDVTGKPSCFQHVKTHSPSNSAQASGSNHYADDRLGKLIEEKHHTRDLALSSQPFRPEDDRPPTGSTFSTASSSSDDDDDDDCTFSTIPQSTTFSTTSSTSLDEEIKQAYDWKELQKLWMSEPSMPPPEPRTKLPHTEHALPRNQACSFKVCATCRPTYRERAYQSLNEILNTSVQMPPIWEFENRRVSEARYVTQIGIPHPSRSRFYAQTSPSALQSSNTLPAIMISGLDQYEDYHLRGAEDDGEPDGHRSEDFNGAHSIGRRSGLRQTIRKALTRVKSEYSVSTLAAAELAGESQGRPQTRARPSSSLLFLRRRSRSSALSFLETPGASVVDTSPLQESVMLMVASNTPLPQTPGPNAFTYELESEGSLVSERMGNGGGYFSSADIIGHA